MANTSALERAGWTVVRVWEHENVADVVASVDQMVKRLRDARWR